MTELQPGEDLLVDARGHRCPVPTLKLRRALEKAAKGAVVVLLADDPLARIDVPHFAAAAGHTLLEQSFEDGLLRFRLRREASAVAGDRG
jgi:tRNA 2-thiouridine synthesizing protein A